MGGAISVCFSGTGQSYFACTGNARGLRQRFAFVALRDGSNGAFGELFTEYQAVPVLFAGDVFFCADIHSLPSLPEHRSADLFYPFVRFSDFIVLLELPVVCGVFGSAGFSMRCLPQQRVAEGMAKIFYRGGFVHPGRCSLFDLLPYMVSA